MVEYVNALAMRLARNLVLPLWVVLLIAQHVHASPIKPILRHVKGIHGIGMDLGIASIGKSLAIDWSYYLAPCWQIKMGIGTEAEQSQDNTYWNLFTQPVCANTLYGNNKNFFFNILGGVRIQLENNQPKKKKERDRSGNIGLVLGAETELFLIGKFEILLSGGTRIFLLQSAYGRMDYFLNMGFRMSF